MADPEYCAVWYLLVLKIVRDFDPDFIFVSAGDYKDPFMCLCFKRL